MSDFVIARIIHVVAVILWIGGVGFVTLVAIPAVGRDNSPAVRLSAFQRLESGFAPQARVWVALAGVSGLWMCWRADLWHRFAEPSSWWMAAMVGVWAVFALMLYVLEPLVIHRRMLNSKSPAADFRRMAIMHRILLLASLVTAGGAVGGSHGLW